MAVYAHSVKFWSEPANTLRREDAPAELPRAGTVAGLSLAEGAETET
jgi:hypothetical protein